MARGDFRILSCATPGVHGVTAKSRHEFAPHVHEEYGLGIIHQGAQRWRSDRRQVEAGAGSAIMVNPGEVHDGEPVTDVGRAWTMLYFDPGIIAEAARDVGFRRIGEFMFSSPIARDRRVAGLLLRLFEAETRTGADSLDREELLLLITRRIGRRVSPSRNRLIPGSIALAKERLDDDPAASVTLAELAQLAGSSRYRLLRSFARATGLTPHAYLLQKRVSLAGKLLRLGEPIAGAAIASGFADQSHLTRAFVRRFGFTPGAFVRSLGH